MSGEQTKNYHTDGGDRWVVNGALDFGLNAVVTGFPGCGGGSSDLGEADVLDLVNPGDPDHTAGLARALATGKPVMFRGGVTYNISAMQTLPSNTTVFSFGGRANIKMATTAKLFLINGTSNVHISGLNVDGSSLANGSPIDFEGASDCSLQECDFFNSRTIKVFAGSTRVLIKRVRNLNSSLHGVQIDGLTTFGNIVTECEFRDGVGFGICLTEGTFKNEISFNKTLSNGVELIGVTYKCWGNRIIGNHAEGTGDNGISVTGYDNLVVGNTCIRCFHNGICLYGSNNVATGNSCRNNGQRFLVDGSNWSGIHIFPEFGGAGYQNTVTGNVCADDQSTPTQAWGTRASPHNYASWVTGNTVGIGAYVVRGSNVYVSATSGTIGSTPPTHTTGTVSDGGVSWTFLFGLLNVPGNLFLGAADNVLVGNITYGNRIAQAIDQSSNANSDIGGNHSYIRTIGNASPQGVLTAPGGSLFMRGGTSSPWLAAYVNSGGATSNNNLWQTLQPRALGTRAARPTLGSGFEGAQWWDTTQLRMVLNAGASLGGSWLDALGRQDPVTALTSVGTTQADALALVYAHSTFAAGASGSGAMLPVITFAGMEMDVFNDGANALLIYPAAGSTINDLASAAPISIAPGAGLGFTSVSSTAWRAR